MSSELTSAVLIIGAASGIAQAITRQILKSTGFGVVSISRQQLVENPEPNRVQEVVCDYSEQNILEVIDSLRDKGYIFHKIFVCNGLLHSADFMPEKKLADLNEHQLTSYFQANVITPMLWLAQMENLSLHPQTQITLFTARVGSIGDNRLGGWYGYRSSKAALNMMVKCAAIELKRRHKSWQFVLFHPGTTDTHLSKPFQANVRPEKLFETDFVAKQLLDILQKLKNDPDSHEQPLWYLDWQGQQIQW